jgi:hypothetical protein
LLVKPVLNGQWKTTVWNRFIEFVEKNFSDLIWSRLQVLVGMLVFRPPAPGQKISGQVLRPPEDKLTIHRAHYAVKGPNRHATSSETKFFNSLDMNY